MGHREARGGGAADARRHHLLPRAPGPGHQGDAAGGAVLRTARTWELIDIFQSRPYACGWFGCIVDRAGTPKPPGRGPVSGPARSCVLGGVRRPSRPPHGRLRGCGPSAVSASCRAGCARWSTYLEAVDTAGRRKSPPRSRIPGFICSDWPARPGTDAGSTCHPDGRFVTDVAGLRCALGEAVAGPGRHLDPCWGMLKGCPMSRTARQPRRSALTGRPVAC